MKNYYAILEVPDGSGWDEIQQSYLRLKEQHQGSDSTLAELQEAYEALTPQQTGGELRPVRRCPMGMEAQCPVLLGQVTPGDKFCPECGYLLAGMDALSEFETAGSLDSPKDEIRLEEPGGRVHRLRPGVTVVGRENADIVLADKTVSRRHAQLEVAEDGTVILEDLGSTNGTQVAGDRLVPHVPRQIFTGDRVRFGSAVTELRIPQTLGTVPERADEEKSNAEPALAQLVEMRDGDGQIYPLVPGATTFGRRQDNTVVLPGDPYVSSSHAQILASDMVFRLTDVGSTNGTLLNGARLAINEPVVLTPGDVILIGSTALRFEWAGSAQAEASGPDEDIPAYDAATYAEG